MREQLLEAWKTASTINLILIDNLDEESMQKTLSSRGGRNVRDQLVHINQVRMQWLEIIAKDIFKNIKPIDIKSATDKKTLRHTLEESGKAIEGFIEQSSNEGGKVKSFKKGLIPFISYLIAHEAHHRGNILLTVKQSGVKIPDALKWGIWDWGKL